MIATFPGLIALYCLTILHVPAGLWSSAALTDEPLFDKVPGIVSYTFRREFAKDVPGTLDRIKSLGVTDMEFSNLFGQSAEDLRKMLDERGMVCSSLGVSYDDFRDNTDEVAANAKALGAKFVRVAWIPHKGQMTLEKITEVAGDFNRRGRHLREKHGLIFCYHNHGYEFVPHLDGTLFDELMRQTLPEDVSVELDILWVKHPGVEPETILEKYGSRIKLMHLKDLKKGVKGDFTGSTAVENDVALGTGQINMPAVLKAAKKAGVKHYYLEDESPNIQTQIPASIQYLKDLVIESDR